MNSTQLTYMVDLMTLLCVLEILNYAQGSSWEGRMAGRSRPELEGEQIIVNGNFH